MKFGILEPLFAESRGGVSGHLPGMYALYPKVLVGRVEFESITKMRVTRRIRML